MWAYLLAQNEAAAYCLAEVYPLQWVLLSGLSSPSVSVMGSASHS
jgi:hypothetical protein